jgi:hypothetical protein
MPLSSFRPNSRQANSGVAAERNANAALRQAERGQNRYKSADRRPRRFGQVQSCRPGRMGRLERRKLAYLASRGVPFILWLTFLRIRRSIRGTPT